MNSQNKTGNITYFENMRETNSPKKMELVEFLDIIKYGQYVDLVEQIRVEQDDMTRSNLKKDLPAACISGEFTTRSKAGLVKHSGLVCLDFDKFENKTQLDSFRLEVEMFKNEFVHAVFTSPSGNGMKVIVKVPAEADNHESYFNALGKYFDSPNFDKACKDVARLCFVSYDEEVYYNEHSQVWDTLDAKTEERKIVKPAKSVTIPMSGDAEKIKVATKWYESNHPIAEGDRNNNLMTAACYMNELGISEASIRNHFKQYEEDDFGMEEINKTIGSALNSSTHNSKELEDRDAPSDIKNRVSNGSTKEEEVQKLVDERGMEEEDAKEAIEEVVNRDFWDLNEKGGVKLDTRGYMNFLKSEGFGNYRNKKSSDDTPYKFVRITDNVMSKVLEDKPKTVVQNYVEERGAKKPIVDYFWSAKIYGIESHLNSFNEINVEFEGDSKGKSYFHYKNGTLMVEKDKTTMLSHSDLDGAIWDKSVLNREYMESSESSDFEKFVSNICNNDAARKLSMDTTIGYLICSYKESKEQLAVVIMDEVISRKPQGGTGKGILTQAIEMMKSMVTIDGKDYNPRDRFRFQNVGLDTRVVAFDDVREDFDFEDLFSVITNYMKIEEKNKGSIRLNYKESPKIMISTNYSVRGNGESHKRRKHEVYIHPRYSSRFQPSDDFDKQFFSEDDWDESDWAAFDAYMIRCIQLFLNKGLVKMEVENQSEHQLRDRTCHNFLDWTKGMADTGKTSALSSGSSMKAPAENTWVSLEDYFNGYISVYKGKEDKFLSQEDFAGWMEVYGELFYPNQFHTEHREGKLSYFLGECGDCKEPY